MNKDRLLRFLPKFLEDRTDDDQFNDEKAWLVKAIGNLPDSIEALRKQTAAARPAENAQPQQKSMNSTQVR